MTEDVKKALAWADMRTTDLWGVVRASAGTPFVFVDPNHVREVALDRIADELRRLDGQRCETCRHQFNYAKDAVTLPFYCGKASVWGHSVAQTPCSRLGYGCRAHEPRT